MKHLLYIVTFLLVHNFTVMAQKHAVNIKSFNNRFCATDLIHDEKMQNDVAYRMRYEQSSESRRNAQEDFYRLASGVYQVPIVVHVMHNGEALGVGTNISDTEVRTGVRYLNNFWRKVSGSKGDGNGVDMKIEFVLAVQDEKGNSTNGIVRKDMSAHSNYVNHGVGDLGMPEYERDASVNSLKEFSIWNPSKYYNVWLVHKIDNSNCLSEEFIAGYAYYASEHGKPNDGAVVLSCAYIDESDETWAHEMGHAFNLPHTFDGDDDSNNGVYQCGDDGIEDTPMHIRSMFIDDLYNDCDNTDVNPCDPNFYALMSPTHKANGTHQDHIHNYMDYTGCANEFTFGQRAVVKSALLNERASFLTINANTALTPTTIASVDFSVESPLACLGSSITFTNESTSTPNAYTNESLDGITFDWTFDNGVNPPYYSIDQNPKITFDYTGNYTVTLAVKNAYGTDSLTKSNFITVSEPVLSTCNSSSRHHSASYGLGVANLKLHTINHSTSTYIPESSMQDFTCSKNTILTPGVDYNLSATYKADSYNKQFLEVWIDWNNNGVFDLTNDQGVNERVWIDSIGIGLLKTVSTTLTLPGNYLSNQLLRMRVISNSGIEPQICGEAYAQRADDYGILIRDLVEGCTVVDDCNFNPAAELSDASCVGIPSACDSCEAGVIIAGGSLTGACDICLEGSIVDQDDDDDGVCNADEVEACKDLAACNYDAGLTTDANNTLCTYPTEDYLDCFGTCLNDHDGDEICDEEIGIQEYNHLNLTLYPNPVEEKVYLVVDRLQDYIAVEIINIMGEVLMELELRNLQSVEVHVGHLSDGMYLIKASNDKNTIVLPWVKQ